MDTFLLYARGDVVVMSLLTHKGSKREAGELGRQILLDSRESESTNFITKHI